MKEKIGILSFFAGAGFLDLGFDSSKSFETVFVNEYHKPFLDTYKSSRLSLGIDPPVHGYSASDICSFLECDEIKKITNKSRKQYKLVGFIGGPPCPDFSVGGKNKGVTGENGKLSKTYVNLIIENQPDFFLFENVKGLYRTKKHKEFFEEMKLMLNLSGYHLSEKLINTIEYGTPQDRERIILIGFKESVLKNSKESIDSSFTLKSFDWSYKVKFNSKTIFSKKWPTQDKYIENSVKPSPKGIVKSLTVEHWFKKNDVTNHPNANHFFQPRAGLVKFQQIPEGDDLKKSYKRLHRWRYSPTAAYGNNEVHLHPYKSRRISVAEALAIQSLPKKYIIPDNITLSNMFKTIGNGVPYLAARGLAESINNYIQVMDI